MPDDLVGGDTAVRPWDPDEPDLAWATGSMTVLGRVASASNGTFLVDVTDADGQTHRCIHKPVIGERPLWDFPTGTLAEREVAAARMSVRAGFDVVPPTTLVEGPLGLGMLQRFIAAGPLRDWVRVDAPGATPPGWFAVLQGVDAEGDDVVLAHADRPELRRIALFDAIINNSDRKGYHLLPEDTGAGAHVWGVDHGVTWHTDDKLRTIIWGWAGADLTDAERALVAAADAVVDGLNDLITVDEVAAAHRRCARLLTTGVFPEATDDWPAIPWPPL